MQLGEHWMGYRGSGVYCSAKLGEYWALNRRSYPSLELLDFPFQIRKLLPSLPEYNTCIPVWARVALNAGISHDTAHNNCHLRWSQTIGGIVYFHRLTSI